MHARHWIILAAVVLGVVVVPTFGASGGSTDSCATSVATVENVSTFEDPDGNATSAELSGEARVSDNDEFLGWFQYRAVASGGDWRTTNRTEVVTNSCGRGLFSASLTGLAPNRTYEYRAVAATANDTARGDVKTFSTASTAKEATPTVTGTPTRTPTPVPCPNYRGPGALCTRTPTPPTSPHTDPGTSPEESADVFTDEASRDDPAVWLAGLAPLLGWIATVAVVAPLVLGGLIVLAPRLGDGGS